MRRTRCLRDCNTIIRYENRERRVLFAALPVFCVCVEMLRGTWTRRLRVSVIQRGTQYPVSDANPAKRIASEKEEQGSERSFRRKAEVESSGLCDDAIPQSGAGQYVAVTPAKPTGGFFGRFAPSE